MLIHIGKISICQLYELLKVSFHSFRNTGLVRKTEKWKFKLQLIYSDYLEYVCTTHKSSSLNIKNMLEHAHFQFL